MRPALGVTFRQDGLLLPDPRSQFLTRHLTFCRPSGSLCRRGGAGFADEAQAAVEVAPHHESFPHRRDDALPIGAPRCREDTAAVGDHHLGDAELACPSSKLAADPGERVIRGGGWTHRYLMSPEVTTRNKLAVTAVSDGGCVGPRCARRECGRPSRGREVRPGRAAKVTAPRSALRTPNDSP